MDYRTYINMTVQERIKYLQAKHYYFFASFQYFNMLLVAFTVGFLFTLLLDFVNYLLTVLLNKFINTD